MRLSRCDTRGATHGTVLCAARDSHFPVSSKVHRGAHVPQSLRPDRCCFPYHVAAGCVRRGDVGVLTCVCMTKGYDPLYSSAVGMPSILYLKTRTMQSALTGQGGQRLGTSMMVCRRMVHQRIRCGAAVSRNVELLCKDLLGSQSWSMNPMWEYFLPKHACGAACAPKRSCRCASEGLTVRVPCPSTPRCLADRRGCRRRTSLPVSVVTSRLSRLLGRESLRGDILWSIQNASVT